MILLKSLLLEQMSSFHEQSSKKDNYEKITTQERLTEKKNSNRESITLLKGDKTLSENLKMAETFNIFFSNIAKEMNISLGKELLTIQIVSRIQFKELQRDSKKHPSVVAIFENHKDSAFSFRHVSLDEITKEIKRLDVKKACQNTDISTKVIKSNSDIFADFFFFNLNNCIASSVFLSNLKMLK